MIKSSRSGRLGIKLFASVDGIPVSIHESIRAAAIDLGLDRSNIRKCMKGKIKSTGGYTFVVYNKKDYQC